MYKYFTEIKNRLLILLITWLSTTITAYSYKEIIIYIITKSYFYQINIKNQQFIFTNIYEIFFTYTNLITFISNQILIIFTLFHFFNFLSSAFFKQEYFFTRKFIKTCILIWLLSTIAINNLIIPIIWSFFVNFNNQMLLNFHFEAKLSEYIKFYTYIFHKAILFFQILHICIILTYYYQIRKDSIKYIRKILYYLAIVLSTLLIPSDILSQFGLSVFIIVVIEILIILNLFKNFKK